MLFSFVLLLFFSLYSTSVAKEYNDIPLTYNNIAATFPSVYLVHYDHDKFNSNRKQALTLHHSISHGVGLFYGQLKQENNPKFINNFRVLTQEYKLSKQLPAKVHDVICKVVDVSGNTMKLIRYTVGYDAKITIISPTRVAIHKNGTIPINELADLPFTLWIVPKPKHAIRDTDSIALMSSTPALTYPGNDQTILIIDTGLDSKHCSFYDPIHAVNQYTFTSYNPITIAPSDHTKILGYIRYPLTDYSDFNDGHGTHVASTALGNSDCGSNNNKGVVPNSRVLFVDAAIVDNNMLELPSSIETALLTAYNAGVRIHSASWGTPTNGDYTDDDAEFDEFAFYHPDFTNVVACGNDYPFRCGSPAIGKNVISTGSSDGVTAISYFSSTGPTNDGRITPLLLVPGSDVLGARSTVLALNGHTFVSTKSGTSMATPFLAGMCASLDEYFISESITPIDSLRRATLISSARDVNNQYSITNRGGYGIPRVFSSDLTHYKFYSNILIQRNDVDIYSFDMSVVGRLTFALSWTDEASGPNDSGTLLKNDLNLRVVYNGNIYYGNKGTQQVYDTVNTNERVVLSHSASVLDNSITVFVSSTAGMTLSSIRYSLVIYDKELGLVPPSSPSTVVPPDPITVSPPSKATVILPMSMSLLLVMIYFFIN